MFFALLPLLLVTALTSFPTVSPSHPPGLVTLCLAWGDLAAQTARLRDRDGLTYAQHTAYFGQAGAGDPSGVAGALRVLHAVYGTNPYATPA